MVYDPSGNAQQESTHFDLSIYYSKYVIPVLEKKRLVFFVFLICLLISAGLATLVKPQFITTATLLVEEPRSTIPSRSRWETGEIVPQSAKREYIYSELQKLQKGFFAADVIKALPAKAREELTSKAGILYQIVDGFGKVWNTIWTGNQVWGDKKPFGKEKGSQPDASNEKALIGELQNRLDSRSDYGTSVVKLSIKTFKSDIGTVLLSKYIDVWIERNLQDNKKEASAVSEFALMQREKAYREYQEAEQKMIDFRRRYEMPAELEVARDVELQLEIDRVNSALKLAKQRYQMLDQMHLETRMKEAGIVGNVEVIGPPSTAFAPAKIAGKNIIIAGIISGLVIGIGLVLLLDFLKGPIRHENDIIVSTDLPVLGYIPKV
ncbi:MAG: hypothetical protein JRJ85_13910 [Deltaproteobacteria bacterium]|nr:hypothetical protein [Deltaproteobacteria bacterium]